MLAHAAVAPFLLSRGFAEPRHVVAGQLRVRDLSGRNPVFLAEVADRLYVVKQGEVAHEAAVLRALAGPLRGQVPEVLLAEERLLVLGAAAGRHWGALPVRRGLAGARALGRLLRTLESVALPPRVAPAWDFSFDPLPAAALDEFTAGGLELIARVQRDADLCARLAAAQSRGAPEVAVHGDLRWENCVASGRRLVLVDWEDAGQGPRGWDVACAVAEYLRVWIASAPMAAADPELIALADVPLERVQAAIGQLWAAYGGRDAERLGELVAVRLLETAVARAAAAPSFPVAVLVNLAANLLRRPREAASALLGL